MGLFSASSLEIGKDAESLACRYLQKQGLRLVERNFRARCGEIDLVMQDRRSLVFVEVRYRKHDSHGGAADSVTPYKQNKLIKTALYYLQRHPQLAEQPCRFDVIAIRLNNNKPAIDWIENAFNAE